MSNEAQATVEVDETAATEEKPERRASKGIDEVLAVYIPMALEGGHSWEDIAEKLDMDRDSLSSKVSAQRTELLAATSVFQVGDRKVTGEILFNESKAKEKDPKKRLTYRQILQDPETYKMVTRGTEIPKLKTSGRTAASKSDLANLVKSLVGQAQQSDDSDSGESDSTES